MRNMTLRKSVYFQLVATIFVFLLTITLPTESKSEELKPVIADALTKGDTTLALDLLDQEIALDLGYHYNYFTKGRIFFERGQFGKAKDQFAVAFDKKSKDYESLYYLGLSQLELGELEEARKTFKEGIKKDKDLKHRFEDGLGLVFMKEKNYNEADTYFRKAIVGDDQIALYHIHLGDVNLANGVAALAPIEYEKAVALDTAGKEVYYHWAEACLEMKDYSCAIEKLKIVLQKDSTHAQSWMRAAGIYFKAARSSRTRDEQTNRFKETIGAYKRYLELSNAPVDSSNVRVYFELAMSYSALNGFEDAVEYYQKVLAIPYEPRDIYFNYGKALWGIKDYVKAAEILEKHVAWAAEQDDTYTSSISDYELYQLIGDAYYYRDDRDYFTAITNYKKALEDNMPERLQLRILQNIALGYNNLKSYDQAFEYYQKRIALGVDEKYAFLYKYAGNCALAIGANTSGNEDEGMLEDDIEAEPVAAVEETNVNYYELAVENLIKYLEFTPNDTSTITTVGSTYLHQLSDCANGVKYYEMALALDPGNCDALKYLGYGYLTGVVCTKSYSKAIQYLTKAVSCMSGDCEDIGLILGIAQSYHLLGAEKAEKGGDAKPDYKNAYDWYSRVLKCDPNNKDATEGKSQLEFEI